MLNQPTVYDPWADSTNVNYEYGINIVSKLSKEEKFDAIINAVAHKQFANIDLRSLCVENGVIYDVKGILPKEIIDARL